MKRIIVFFIVLMAAGFITVSYTGCNRPALRTPEDELKIKVAKVDTEYVYELNIEKSVADYRKSVKVRLSNFVGFSPDEILDARKNAIDQAIRDQIKRLPGVTISNKETTDLALKDVEELAWTLYRRLTQDNEDFATLARHYSSGLTARNGGKLPAFEILQNPEPYQALAYTMKVGEISEPFNAWDGWRIIRLDAIKEDKILGKMFEISMIQLKPDMSAAEAKIIERRAKQHTIEVLDPKYNAHQAIIDKNYSKALQLADQAISRNYNDELAHYLKARALWGLGKKDEALEQLIKAAETGRVADGLIPYYHFYRGIYLEEMGRLDEAKEVFRQSADSWHQQDIYLAFDLLDKFKQLGDEEYARLMQNEIDIIIKQDAVVLTFGRTRSKSGGVIVSDQGRVEGSSAEYIPGFQK